MKGRALSAVAILLTAGASGLAGGTAHADANGLYGCGTGTTDLSVVWHLVQNAASETVRNEYYGTCTYVAVPGTGSVTLDVYSGSAAVDVTCTVGSASFSRSTRGHGYMSFFRAGSCLLKIHGFGDGYAYAD
jgi:hypothetical protein